jgi:hypothetical protein
MISTRRGTLALLGLLAASPLWPGVPEARDARPRDDDDDDTALPNVFISPCGQPFRAHVGAPYPVDLWFKQADANGDGKLDRAEFVADAAAFFKKLDFRGEGVLTPTIVALYEQRIAPEVLGKRVRLSRGGARLGRDGARLWLAQGYGGGGGHIDPGGDVPNSPDNKPKGLNESGAGASPYSFFDEPEPLTAADFDFNGFIRKANFLKLADSHFTTLDRTNAGFLTLAGLPLTPIQKQLRAEEKKKKKKA